MYEGNTRLTYNGRSAYVRPAWSQVISRITGGGDRSSYGHHVSTLCFVTNIRHELPEAMRDASCRFKGRIAAADLTPCGYTTFVTPAVPYRAAVILRLQLVVNIT